MIASPSALRASSGFAGGLVDDFRAALDPVAFARRLGIEPDPWQAEVLRSDARRLLLNCARQSGKSTVTAVLAAHEAIYRPGSMVVLTAPSQRQSLLLAAEVTRMLQASHAPLASEAASKVILHNGSQIVALPGTEATTRGLSGVSLLVLDEASRVVDDLYHALTPMTAVTQGRVIAMSTPAGKRGWWSNAWHDAAQRWERIHVRADQCPRIDSGWLEEQRRNMGEAIYRQEFFGEFTDSIRAVFRLEDFDRAIDPELQEWDI